MSMSYLRLALAALLVGIGLSAWYASIPRRPVLPPPLAPHLLPRLPLERIQPVPKYIDPPLPTPWTPRDGASPDRAPRR